MGPVYASSPDPEAELEACHVASLAVADEVGARSVGFPAISTGVYGYPMGEAAHIAVRAVVSARTKVERVRFVLFDAAARAVFLEAWERRGSDRQLASHLPLWRGCIAWWTRRCWHVD